MPQQKLYNVQALRFVAASAVATSHMADLLIPHDARTAWFWAVPWTAGVDLFFIISGFIMLLLTHDSFGSRHMASLFLRRRLARIVPIYWLFTAVIVAAIVLAGGRLKGTTATLDQIVTSLVFLPWPRDDGQLNPVLAQGWTLNYEAFFYLAFALALLSRRGVVVLCGAFCALAASHGLWPEHWFMLRFWSDPSILEFVAGIGIAHIYLKGVRISGNVALLLVASGIIFFIALTSIRLGAYSRIIHFGLPAAVICASMILSPEPSVIGPVQRFIRLGGDASYALYLSHYMVVNVVALVWTRIGLQRPWTGVAIGLTGSIIFSILFHLYIERRITRWLRRRREPEHPAVTA